MHILHYFMLLLYAADFVGLFY